MNTTLMAAMCSDCETVLRARACPCMRAVTDIDPCPMQIAGRCAFLAAFVLVGCAAAGEEDASPVETRSLAASAGRGVVWSSRLPFSDVSGLGVRRWSGQTTLFAVGDARASLVSFELGEGERPAAAITHDLSGLFGERDSQFEAVTADGAGRVFLLVESRAEIAVLDPQLRRKTNTLKIRFPVGHPLAERWSEDENSRGEGMILLANGHVLVAKEKKPPAIVELAPRGEAAEGYRSELALGERAFPLPEGGDVELVATKYWTFSASDEDRLGDISELALDADGRIVLASDQGRAIARVGHVLDLAQAKIPVEAFSRLPSSIEKPEGLVLVGDRVFVATDDHDASRKVLFEVEPW